MDTSKIDAVSERSVNADAELYDIQEESTLYDDLGTVPDADPDIINDDCPIEDGDPVKEKPITKDDILKLIQEARRGNNKVMRRKMRNVSVADIRLGLGGPMVFGWLKRGEIVASPTGKACGMSARVYGSSPRRIGYPNARAFMAAYTPLMAPCYNKTFSGPTRAVAGTATVATCTDAGGGMMGVILSVTDSITSADRAQLDVTITCFVKSTDPTPAQTLNILIQPIASIAQVAILTPINFGGMAQLAKYEKVVATIAADKMKIGSIVNLESLNSYDIR